MIGKFRQKVGNSPCREEKFSGEGSGCRKSLLRAIEFSSREEVCYQVVEN